STCDYAGATRRRSKAVVLNGDAGKRSDLYDAGTVADPTGGRRMRFAARATLQRATIQPRADGDVNSGPDPDHGPGLSEKYQVLALCTPDAEPSGSKSGAHCHVIGVLEDADC